MCVYICINSQYHAWGVFIIQSNPTLLHFTKGFAKGFLEVLCSPGSSRKGFSFSNIFFSCSDATLKVCSISVSSSVRFNQYFLRLWLSAGHCAWHCGGTKMIRINIQREVGSANALTVGALRERAWPVVIRDNPAKSLASSEYTTSGWAWRGASGFPGWCGGQEGLWWEEGRNSRSSALFS